MVAKIIDGKAAALRIEESIGAKVKHQVEQGHRPPGLAVVLVGEDPASKTYVASKVKMAQRCGFHAVQRTLPADISQERLLAEIDDLNSDSRIDGILLQLPLPTHLNTTEAIERINPVKDADGLTSTSLGRIVQSQPIVNPCTPAGVMVLLEQELCSAPSALDLSGKKAIVVGRSVLVGKPLALLLLDRNATVTIAHSKSPELPKLCSEADILVAACGVPNLIKAEWIKPGAIVIDVGINRLPNGKLCGDVERSAAEEMAASFTPVPGGVGPMTVAMLMSNTFDLYRQRLA